MDRRLQVVEQILECTRCELHAQCEGPVPFFGATPNRVAVIGEAPGAQEDAKGRPFIGPSGEMIRQHLTQVGIDPESVTWLNTASCFPHGTPTTEHVEACATNKLDQLQLIDPEHILLLGKVALWGQNPNVESKRVRGHPFLVDGRLNLPTFHPSAALRNRNFEKAMHEDLEVFKSIIDGEPWSAHISDKCAKCGEWMIWLDDDGLPWCERHAPPECGQRLALLESDRAEARRRLNPLPPEQLAIGG